MFARVFYQGIFRARKDENRRHTGAGGGGMGPTHIQRSKFFLYGETIFSGAIQLPDTEFTSFS